MIRGDLGFLFGQIMPPPPRSCPSHPQAVYSSVYCSHASVGVTSQRHRLLDTGRTCLFIQQ